MITLTLDLGILTDRTLREIHDATNGAAARTAIRAELGAREAESVPLAVLPVELAGKRPQRLESEAR